uniref:Uncharacterized protein n=1 Tax=Lepeophtheirus salmonis TaxID=72036 RepID=A0A0K2TCM9_LEPSM
MVQNGFMIDVQLLGDSTTCNMMVSLDIFHDFTEIYDDRAASTLCLIASSAPEQNRSNLC